MSIYSGKGCYRGYIACMYVLVITQSLLFLSKHILDTHVCVCKRESPLPQLRYEVFQHLICCYVATGISRSKSHSEYPMLNPCYFSKEETICPRRKMLLFIPFRLWHHSAYVLPRTLYQTSLPHQLGQTTCHHATGSVSRTTAT